MRLIICSAFMSATVLLFAPAAQADPAVELPSNACNDGTARAYETSNPAHSNSPSPPHNVHGCHVHVP